MLAEVASSSLVAWDTETNGLGTEGPDFKIVGVAVATSPWRAWYVPVGHVRPERQTLFSRPLEQLPTSFVLRSIQNLLERDNNIYWNYKFDYKTWVRVYKDVLGVDVQPECMADVMLMARNADDTLNNLKLKSHTKWFLGRNPDEYEWGDKFDQVSLHDALEYAGADPANTFGLYNHWLPLMEGQIGVRSQHPDRPMSISRVFWDVEMPCITVVAEMERAGVRLDEAYVRDLADRLTEELKEPEANARQCMSTLAPDFLEDFPDFRLSNTDKLGLLLYDHVGLVPPNRNESVDKEAIEDLLLQNPKSPAVPLLESLLDFRKLDKVRSTYTLSMLELVCPRTDKLHPSLLQHGAKSGRFACAAPNLQNLTRDSEEKHDVRRGFVADKGRCFVASDLNSAEMKVAAALSRCPELTPIISGIRLFNEETGEVKDIYNSEENALLRSKGWQTIDIHKWTAASYFAIPYGEVTSGQRQSGKPVNFGILYGKTAHGFAKDLRTTAKEGQKLIDAWLKAYPGVASWIEATKLFAFKYKYSQTAFGRRRRIPSQHLGMSYEELDRAGVFRYLVNHPIQGTVGDLIKLSMVGVHNRLKSEGLDARLVMQIHDELIVDSSIDCATRVGEIMVEEMTWDLFGVTLDCDCEYKLNWSKSKQVVPGLE